MASFTHAAVKIGKIWHMAALLLALVPLGSAQAAEAGGDYTLTRQYGSVFFRVFHQEFLTLVGRFDSYAGTLHLDPDNLANSKLTASVEMGSLNMADGDVTETLVNSSAWFNASVFPQATFTSTSAVVTADNEVDFVGDLNFLGMTKPWTLHVTFHGGSDGEIGGSTVGISGRGVINRLDFGMDQYRNMAADTVEIEVNVKFNRN
jgi:polyisoprenoid-binding protein YceI